MQERRSPTQKCKGVVVGAVPRAKIVQAAAIVSGNIPQVTRGSKSPPDSVFRWQLRICEAKPLARAHGFRIQSLLVAAYGFIRGRGFSMVYAREKIFRL